MKSTRTSKSGEDFYKNFYKIPNKGSEFFDACQYDDTKKAINILDSKVSVYGHNYLDVAIVFKSHEVLKLLLERKIYSPDDLKEALVTAAGNNNLTALSMLLSLEESTPNVTVASNQTPLMVAAGLGKYEACQLLLEKKADVSPKHELFYKTAFDFAKENGHQEIADLIEQYTTKLSDSKKASSSALMMKNLNKSSGTISGRISIGNKETYSYDIPTSGNLTMSIKQAGANPYITLVKQTVEFSENRESVSLRLKRD